VIDLDIEGFFDNIDHDLMMQVVRHYVSEKWMVLYIQRWLKSPMLLPDGTIQQRTKGTPQGGVISPLLANMFLHVVFDAWMQQHYADTEYGSIRWERYADDIKVHCKSESEAKYILNQIKKRMKACRLNLHPDKTKIVYCKQSNRRGKNVNNRFDFLGFEFRPDSVETQKGKLWLGYSARISRRAKKHIVSEIRRYNIHRKTGTELTGISQQLAPMLRGWIRYFGTFRPYAMQEVFSVLNERLVRWCTNKYKRYRRRKREARQRIKEICKDFPNLFVHWQYGYTP
jgi:group II intron reverse transcriptase/maturase